MACCPRCWSLSKKWTAGNGIFLLHKGDPWRSAHIQQHSVEPLQRETQPKILPAAILRSSVLLLDSEHFSPELSTRPLSGYRPLVAQNEPFPQINDEYRQSSALSRTSADLRIFETSAASNRLSIGNRSSGSGEGWIEAHRRARWLKARSQGERSR